MRRKLAAGNWKMNGLATGLSQLEGLTHDAVDVLICPPATLLAQARHAVRGTTLLLGGQDCHAVASGAHTGDISAEMLTDAGASHVILGHSERRADHGETSQTVCAKAEAALAAGLIPVICVGETLQDRDADRTLDVLSAQMAASVPDAAIGATTVIAYEPVWAIGTGRTATPDQIAAAHAHLRQTLVARFGADGDAFRLLYGGSVKAGNAAEIFAVPDVDGALVGGASLTAADFRPIIDALAAA